MNNSSSNNPIPIKSRIPRYFIPKKYDMQYYINVKNLSYSVQLEISIISNSTNPSYLILHALPSLYTIISLSLVKYDRISDEWIEISNSYLSSLTDSKDNIEDCIYIPISEESQVIKDDELKLRCFVEGDIPLNNTKAGLYFSFNNDTISDQLNVPREQFMKLYRDSFSQTDIKDNNYLQSLIICTINEPSFLRTYMPSFDEPSYKCIYSLKMELDKDYVDSFEKLKCVTNGELIEVKTNKNSYTFCYSDTPIMSSYLFTFVIGNYDFIETVNNDDIKIRVFTPLNRHHDGALAMTLAQKSLKFYQSLFEIPYYYPKLDLICVPSMNYRALENVGCIVFHNYSSLFGHFQCILERKLISRTVCHEISHTWFGNLVTMDWWNDIWLNEGFARIFEFLCLSNIEESEYNYWENFIEMIYDVALSTDEGNDTHPVICEVDSVKNLEDLFDTISYAKGASVIRMLYCLIGEEKFKQSIRLYLNKYKFGNTDTKMLWECFNEITKEEIDKLMENWLTISSHPLINCTIKEVENRWVIFLEQKSMKKDSNDIWTIPLFIQTKSKNIIKIMKEQTMQLDIEKDLGMNIEEIQNKKDYIILNSGAQGFYRVCYQEELLLNIINAYSSEKSKITNIDIYSILSTEHILNNYSKCLLILQGIKEIKSYLILKKADDIYKSIQSQLCPYLGFESILKEEEENNKSINYTQIFSSLVPSNDKIITSLINKLFVYNEESSVAYMNQYNDEFENLQLYYLFIIGTIKDEELIKKILNNFLKYHEFVHKNLKFSIYEIVLNYCYLLPIEQQKQIFDLVFEDYITNYYINSTKIKRNLSNSFLNFSNYSDELIDYILTEKISPREGRNSFTGTRLYYNYKSRGKILNVICKIFDKGYQPDKEYYIIYLYEKLKSDHPLYLALVYYFRTIISSINNQEIKNKVIQYYSSLLFTESRKSEVTSSITKFVENALFDIV